MRPSRPVSCGRRNGGARQVLAALGTTHLEGLAAQPHAFDIGERDRVWYSRQPGYFLSTRLLEPLGAMSAPAFPRISMRILRPEWRCPVLEDG